MSECEAGSAPHTGREPQRSTWIRDFVVSLNRVAYRRDFNSLRATEELRAAQRQDTKIARHGLVGLYY